ncbi:MAG: response regulator [Actinomycetota bacterium]
MSWSNNPELQQMFVNEVTERSARLVEGARALREGTITPHEAGELLREGHTVKGTGRVMGYDEVGSAGLMLEMIWRWLQHGDIAPSPLFGRVLEPLSAAIPRALDNPEELIEAMTAVHEFLEGQDLPEALPEIPALGKPAPAVQAPAPPPVVEAEIIGDGATAVSQDPVATDEQDEATSARDAFAALRREMASGSDEIDTAVEREPEAVAIRSIEEVASLSPSVSSSPSRGPVVSSPSGGGVSDEGADGGGQSDPIGEPEIHSADGGGQTVPLEVFAANETDGAAGASVIEFPRIGATEGTTPDQVEAEPPAASLDTPEPETSEVVVLPSSSRRESPIVAEPTDLGGLVGAVQTWVEEESVTVAAGRLYGLVDHIVSLRMNIESLQEQLAELAEIANADPFFSERVNGLVEGIDPITQASDGIEARALALASVPLSKVTSTLPQLGRYLGRKTGKELRIEVVGDDVLVDRQVLDKLGDAIRQLVVNAVVHGIEEIDGRLGAGKPGTGTVRVEAEQTDVNLRVSVVDDGRGIKWSDVRDKGRSAGLLEADTELSPEALRSLLYQSGFSTLESSDELAGDGEGLAAVREMVEAMNGSLALESTPGVDTKVAITVPIHQAMQKALLVVAGGITWGIPEASIEDVLEMNDATIAVSANETVLEQPGGDIPFAAFAEVMGLTSPSVPTSIVVATGVTGRVALGVESVIGMRRVAAKELGTVLADADADAVTGAALLGGDDVVLLVDTTRLAERQRETVSENPVGPAASVLIVDDSKGVQQVVSSALATSGFQTSVAANVAEALGTLQMSPFDAIVVDFSMPRADGVALTHMVRQRHGDLPIVMLSGVAEGEDIERAREAGVDAFFSKSDFHGGGLADKLRELIAARRASERTA